MVGHQRGLECGRLHQHAAIRSNEVAEVPHFWTGVKGQPSTKLEVYDIPAKASMDSRSTAKAIDYIQARSREGKPFFLYVGFTHFHPPWGVHPDFKNKSGAGIYADTKMEVDHNVGRDSGCSSRLGRYRGQHDRDSHR